MRINLVILILLLADVCSAAVHWTAITAVTPGSTGSWQDCDNSVVPDGAVGVIVRLINSNAAAQAVGLRKNGSTDNRTQGIYQGSHIWAAVGCDASGIFEAYVGTSVTVEIFGYFDGNDEVFFTNGVDKSTASTSSWVDVDISSDTGTDVAIGAIFEWSATASNANAKVRKNGSTDNRTGDRIRRQLFGIIGVDESEIFEQWIDDTAADLFVIGYIKSAAVFHTNAIDRSLSTTSAWTDLTALPAGATGAIYEVSAGQDLTYGFRKNGSSENFSNKVTLEQAYGMLDCDESGIIEGIISSTTVDFFEIGYFTTTSTATRNRIIMVQ